MKLIVQLATCLGDIRAEILKNVSPNAASSFQNYRYYNTSRLVAKSCDSHTVRF